MRENMHGNWAAGIVCKYAFGFAGLVALLAMVTTAGAQVKRKVIIDQDCAGPGGTDMQAVLALVNSPETNVLGITVVTGDAWRDEEVQHTLRLLEIIGRTDIPVLPGAVFPLVNSKEETALWEQRYGEVVYQGAWNFGNPVHGPWEVPPMPEGKPKIRASKEDAAHFLVRMVHQYPHEVTIYEGGPMTNLALAETIDPEFARLAKELVVMGGSIHPETNDPEFTRTPHREFNFWMDPEAARRVLRARWARITLTTVDISVKTHFDSALVGEIAKGTTPSAQYVAKYANANLSHYLWDELAAVAWLDPSVITSWKKMYVDVSIDHGATYGDTLTWPENEPPALHGPLVDVEDNLDKEKFYKEFVELMTAQTPKAHETTGLNAGAPQAQSHLTSTPH
jgi:purine nucleosidase